MNLKNQMVLYLLAFPKRSRINSEGKCPLFIRLSLNGQRTEIALKRYVDPKNWDKTRQCVIGRNSDSQSINEHIRSCKTLIYRHNSRLIEKGEVISVKKLKDLFHGVDRGKKTIIKIFEFHNARMEKQVGKDYAKGTLERFTICLNHLKEFIEKTYKCSDYSLEDIKLQFITDFEYYLKTERNCNNNTAIKYVNNLKKIINEARSYEWISHDPYINYKAKYDTVNREVLTQDEINTLLNKHFDIKRLDIIKDIFLFSCFTGLAYSDVEKLTKDNLYVGIDGEKWIQINRTKTNVTSQVPVLPIAMSILEKYQNNPKCLKENKLLPVPSNQRYNGYLKEIADCCEIKKVLTTHLARHTFATTITLNNNVPIETVSKMLGHTSIKTTQIYSKVSVNKISNDMKGLRNLFNPSNPLKAVNE